MGGMMEGQEGRMACSALSEQACFFAGYRAKSIYDFRLRI
jgi:hypothetical protein